MLNNSERTKFGKLGEEIACEYLIKKGYSIIHRNFTLKFNEIDVIALANDGTLTFVEVKTIREQGYEGFTPEDQLTSKKYRSLAGAARLFAGRNPWLISEEKGWRLDLIAIVLGQVDRLIALRHYENI